MDSLLSFASLYWQIPLGVLLLVLTIFFIWLGSQISKTLKSVENLLDKSVPNLLKATEQLVGVHRDLSTLLTSVDGTVTELNQRLPQLLDNINGITASIQQMSESEIRATTHNIQGITETLNENIAKIDELVSTVTDFSQSTIKHVEYYRDQLSVPVTDFISAWSALKRSWDVFSQARKSSTSDSKDIDSEDTAETGQDE
ncbi:hypothetical protein C6502_22745 [Candidatus Poribacteria bacterium]|nr:MAG: hypothetical protein C6502_22745 [Candidatus Poribacteria bacterium]